MKAESWKRLAIAQKHYEKFGFKYFDVPWTVNPNISNITKPSWVKDYYIEDKVLVGSAEQGFLAKWNVLDSKELYYSITPCFRYEDEQDILHKFYFMKLELFSKDITKLPYIIRCAELFFRSQISWGKRKYLTRKLTDVDSNNNASYDLNYKVIELGSYIYRNSHNKEWVCGTGLAEPRFTQAYTGVLL